MKQLIKIVVLAVAVLLVSTPAYAGWLDKVKEKVGKTIQEKVPEVGKATKNVPDRGNEFEIGDSAEKILHDLNQYYEISNNQFEKIVNWAVDGKCPEIVKDFTVWLAKKGLELDVLSPAMVVVVNRSAMTNDEVFKDMKNAQDAENSVGGLFRELAENIVNTKRVPYYVCREKDKTLDCESLEEWIWKIRVDLKEGLAARESENRSARHIQLTEHSEKLIHRAKTLFPNNIEVQKCTADLKSYLDVAKQIRSKQRSKYFGQMTVQEAMEEANTKLNEKIEALRQAMRNAS